MEPSPQQILEFNLSESLGALATWVGMDEQVACSWATLIGWEATTVDELNGFQVRPLAMMTEEEHNEVLTPWEVNGVAPSLLNKIQARTVHKIARLMFTQAPTPGAAPVAFPPAPPAIPEVVKLPGRSV